MSSPAAVVFQDVLELQSQKSVIEEVKLTAKTLKVEFTFLVFEKKKNGLIVGSESKEKKESLVPYT